MNIELSAQTLARTRPATDTSTAVRSTRVHKMDTEIKSFILLVCAIALAHGGVRVMWGAICPIVFGERRWKALSDAKQYEIRLAFNCALNGILAPALVYPALTSTPPLNPNGLYATVFPRHEGSVLGCAASVGYLLYDFLAMLSNYTVSMKANGVVAYNLYLWHHALSVAFWPVAVLHNSFVFFVNWFVASEASSAFLAARGAMLSLGTINTPLGMVVQFGFVLSYFMSRIYVMPNLVKSIYYADWGQVPAWQANIARFTVPLPFMLNIYWGILIVRSMVKVLFGKKKGKGKKAA